MKKRYFFFLAAFLLVGFPVLANPVSADRALEIARMILQAQPTTKAAGGDVRIVWDGEPVATKAGVQPAFYVVARDGGGFVIIAGDDNVRPVLALSEDGRFETENMPDNVKWWMDRMARNVRSASAQTDEVRQLWSQYTATKGKPAIITGTITDKVEHLTPEWDQGNNDSAWGFPDQVFNKFCPKQDGAYTLTGCVATAMAEILAYQSGQYLDKMPVAGVGTVGGYDAFMEGYVTPAPYSLGYQYDWAGMRSMAKMKDIRGASASVRESIGHLMADCGAIAHVQYSVGGSTADYTHLVSGFAEHFHFNKAAHVERPFSYSSAHWKKMLRTEVSRRPIYYSGGSHAFVMDGHGIYDGDDVFHVNFGWGGLCNGYYSESYLYDGDENYTSEYAEALIDFFLDEEGTSTYRKAISLMNYQDDDGVVHDGLTTDRPIRRNESFLLSFGAVLNAGALPYTGKLRVVVEDKEGALKEELYMLPVEELVVAGLYWWNYWLCPTCNLSLGDKVKLYFTTNDDGDDVFAPVTWNEDGSVVGELPVMPAAFIHTDSYRVGDYFQFLLMNNDTSYAGTTWRITYPSGLVKDYPQKLGEVQLPEKGTYKVEAMISQDGNVVTDTIAAKIWVDE